MTCPKCGAETAKGQNYCGGCGAQLKNTCPGCSTVNPPFFKYCGQCGRNLVDVGHLLLDRAGLVLAADATALGLVGQKAATVKGKPFSLFVNVGDLVIFYSHWNELMRSAKRQSVEIELHPSPGVTRHAQVEMSRLRGKEGQAPRIHMALSDVTDLRMAMQDAQVMEDLIHMIFTWVDEFQPGQENGRDKTIGSVLEKVGLFSAAEYGFISRIDVKEKCLTTDFVWRLEPGPDDRPPPHAMPVALMPRLFDTLVRDHQFIVNDTESLSGLERKVLHEWLQQDVGAVLCHTIFRRKTPMGVIGVATARPTRWSRHATSLVKLAGRLMAEALPFVRPGSALIKPRAQTSRKKVRPAREPDAEPLETIDIADIEIIEEPPAARTSVPPGSRKAGQDQRKPNAKVRMKFAMDPQPGDANRNPVFAGDDGRYLMSCPQCGFQDAVSGRLFEKMGSAVRVQCPCGHRFRIIRELRAAYRKAVRLDGYFAQALGSGNKLSPGDVWGPMTVKNLSRAGLQFTCGNAGQLRRDDRLQVRFNLDNANQTLIKKTVVVKSVVGNTVGCQFHGTDHYDAAIGFYFL